MTLIIIVLSLFIILETLNIILLYFKPESTKGNAMGFFIAWEASKKDPAVHALMKYLVYWVAGTKLIFIGLLVAILIVGDANMQLVSVGVLIVSISSFYWKLFPLIKQMDISNQLTQKGYSKTLGVMIGSFIGVFLLVFMVALITAY